MSEEIIIRLSKPLACKLFWLLRGGNVTNEEARKETLKQLVQQKIPDTCEGYQP